MIIAAIIKIGETMKKIGYLLLLIIMFIPCLVNAESCDNNKISISSIAVEEKTNNVEEINDATVQGKDVILNLNMSNVGDNVKYRIVIKNDSSDDYLLNKNSIKVSSNYIDYNIESSDNNNIVKAKTAKAFYLNVLYKNQVPDNVFENGFFNDNVTMKLNLSSGKVENPNTGVKYYVFILFIITTMIIMLFVFKKKRVKTKSAFFIIGLSLLIPVGVKALCNVDININSTIKIDKPIVCGSFENDSWRDISYNVKNGNDSCYNVGDTKEIDMGTFGTHTVRIANKSKPEECNQNGFSQTACGFAVEFTDILLQRKMNDNMGTGFNVGGWPASDMRSYINVEIYNAFPNELKSVIINSNVISGHGPDVSSNYTSIDKIYLLSPKEVGFDLDNDTAKEETRILDYYYENNNNNSRLKIEGNYTNYWWLRTACSDFAPGFITVRYDGHYENDGSNADFGVSPAFRIG